MKIDCNYCQNEIYTHVVSVLIGKSNVFLFLGDMDPDWL